MVARRLGVGSARPEVMPERLGDGYAVGFRSSFEKFLECWIDTDRFDAGRVLTEPTASATATPAMNASTWTTARSLREPLDEDAGDGRTGLLWPPARHPVSATDDRRRKVLAPVPTGCSPRALLKSGPSRSGRRALVRPDIQRVGVVFRVREVCASRACSGWPVDRSRRRRHVESGGLDLGVGVVDGFGGVHGGSDGHAAVERFGAESVSDVIDRSHKADDQVGGGVVDGGAVEGGDDLRPVDPVEEHGQVGERDCEVGWVAGLVERVDTRGEQRQGLVEVTVHRFEPNGVACEGRFKEGESVLSDVGKSDTKRVEGPDRVWLGGH